MLPLAYSLDHAGPMAWTAEDCAILLQAMAEYDSSDPTSIRTEIPDYKKELTQEVKGMRIGLLRHFYTTDNKANQATHDAIEAAAKKLEEMGCVVEELKLSPLSEWAACGTIIMIAEAYAIHESNLQTRFMDYGEVFRDRMALAGLISSADYIAALRRRRELIDEFDNAMQNFDIILTATTAREAPKLEEVGKFSIFERPLLTMPFNVTGSPAMSVCCGYTDEGLPLAMQLIGKRFEDSTVLRIADAYERATPWRDRRPNCGI
jgi:aspartyl-tRNA(Asn)/glutamyl-tRNA(Gln) amidotransferase subunit A